MRNESRSPSESDWLELSLGDVLELKRGYDLRETDRSPGDVPVVTSSGISGTHSEAKVKAPGVVTGRYGTIGKVYYITEDFWPHNTALYVRDFKGNCPRFCRYLLETVRYGSHNDKSGVPGVNRNHLHLTVVKRPPLGEQEEIAHILGTLDDKIELNRRMNRTLEAMAQAIFKSWFVDFEPVKAKAAAATAGKSQQEIELAAMAAIAGKPESELTHLTPEQHQSLSQTATLFPDSFQDSELGKIPKGWAAKRWDELSELRYGKSLKGYRDASGPVPVYGTNGQIGFTQNPLWNDEGIIIGRKGAYRGVHYSYVPFHAIDTAFFVAPQVNLSMKWAYYEILRFDINGMDSGSALPSTSRDDFYRLQSVFPPVRAQREFDDFVSMLYEKKVANEKQSQTLAQLRDTLLPKLLSGELSVSDAQSQTEEAVS